MSSPNLRRLLALLALVSLIAVACGSDDDEPEAVDETAEPTEVPTPTTPPTPTPAPDVDATDLESRPVIVVGDRPAPTGLETTDIVVGEGAAAKPGDALLVNYVGVAHSNGLEFDASWDRGQLFRFVLEEGNVIDGWVEGVAGMAVGGRREIAIPSDMAYGAAGSGSGAIGPDEPLYFVVDMVGLVPGDGERPDIEVPEEPATELVTEDLIVGTGLVAAAGDVVHIHYVGAVQSTGEVFDASWDRGPDAVFTFIVGAGFVHAGIDQAIEGMTAGSRRVVTLPPELAYGETSAGNGEIPPNETLTFVVDLVAVEKAAETEAADGGVDDATAEDPEADDTETTDDAEDTDDAEE